MAARCSAPGCREQAKTVGLCGFHYMRQYDGVPLDQPKEHHRPPLRIKASGCPVLGCGRPVAALGMCWGHYKRDLRGDPLYVYLGKGSEKAPGTGRGRGVVSFGPARPTCAERLAMREARIRWELDNCWTGEPNTGCHLWTGDIYPSGYAMVGGCRDPWGGYAHRAVLHFDGVELQPGLTMHARHSCDQPSCINRAHLAYGPAVENIRDRDRRGRNAIAAIDAETALAIYMAVAAGERCVDVAGRFGVPPNLVTRIKTGRSYAWALTDAGVVPADSRAA